MNLDLAIRLNRLDCLDDLLSLGIAPDVRSPSYAIIHGNATALMVAAYWKRKDAVRRLLAAGAAPECVDQAGWTSLLHAVQWTESIHGGYGGAPDSAREIVRVLLEAGADVNHHTHLGWTARMLAVRYRREDVLAELDARGADDHGTLQAELAKSSERGDVEGIRRAVAGGADPDAHVEPFGDTPLTRACYWSGTLELVQALLDAGASVDRRNSRGSTPLMVAAGIEEHNWHHDHPRIVSALIEAGARLDEEDPEGDTALALAERRHHEQSIELLRRAGARPSAPRPQASRKVDAWRVIGTIGRDQTAASRRWIEQWLQSEPALDLLNVGLLRAASVGAADIVDRLLTAGADRDWITELGETALKNAAIGGHTAVAQRLLAAGLDARSRDAVVAAGWARIAGHLDVVSLLGTARAVHGS